MTSQGKRRRNAEPSPTSPSGRRSARERAEAAGLERIAHETLVRQEKSERLKRLRLKREQGDSTA